MFNAKKLKIIFWVKFLMGRVTNENYFYIGHGITVICFFYFSYKETFLMLFLVTSKRNMAMEKMPVFPKTF